MIYKTMKKKDTTIISGKLPHECTGFIFEKDTRNVYDQDGNFLGTGELNGGGLDVIILATLSIKGVSKQISKYKKIKGYN